MEASWSDNWLAWAQTNPSLLLTVCGILLFIEGFPVIGLLVPGLIMVFLLGCLVGLGVLDLIPVLLATALGAFTGDTFNYWLGHRFRGGLLARWPLNKNPDMYQRGVQFFQQYGALSIPLGRFIGPIRSFVPMIAGILRMRSKVYVPMAGLTAILWASAFVFPGMLLGASLDMAAAYATRLSVLLGIVVATVVLIVWLVRLGYAAISRNSPWMLRRLVTWLLNHPRLSRIFSPLFIPAKGEILSIALSGVVLLILLVMLIIATVYLLIGDLGTNLDLRVQAWLLNLRSPVTDPLWSTLVSFTHWPVLIATSLIMTIWWFCWRQPVAGVHWILAVFLSPLFAIALHWPLAQLPIWPAHLLETGSFPDVKITFLTATLVTLPMLLVRELGARPRLWYYLVISAIVTLFVIARLLLDLTYLSAAWSGVLLAVIWVTLVGIGYRVRERTGWPVWRHTSFFFATLILCGSLYAMLKAEENTERWTPRLAGASMTAEQWQTDGWQQLPRYRSTYAQTEEEYLNLQYAGELDDLRELLEADGWQKFNPTETSWWQVISPKPEQDKLPIFGKDLRGIAARLIMTRDHPQGKEVLRLWPSGWQLETASGTQSIWVGTSNLEQMETVSSWFSIWRHSHDVELELPSRYLVQQHDNLGNTGLIRLH